MLNQEQFQGKWKEIKGGIRNLWGRLTDDEIEQYKGNITEVTGLVEERYGETKKEIREKLDHLMESFDNDSDKNITPNESSFARSPLTSADSENLDSDVGTRSSERTVFDERTYEASRSGNSNYSGANPNRDGFGPGREQDYKRDFDSDRNARH